MCVKRTAPLLKCHVQQRRFDVVAGTVDEEVDSPEASHGTIAGGLDGTLVGNVHSHSQGLRTRFGNLSCHRFGTRFIHVRHGYHNPLAGKCPAYLSADASSTARNDDDLLVHPVGSSVSWSLSLDAKSSSLTSQSRLASTAS